MKELTTYQNAELKDANDLLDQAIGCLARAKSDDLKTNLLLDAKKESIRIIKTELKLISILANYDEGD